MPGRSLIDRQLPEWDVRSAHSIPVEAPPDRVYRAARTLDLRGSRIVRGLYRMRGLPEAALTFEGLERMGFVLLAEAPEHEFVLGLVGAFWTWRGGIVRLDGDAFAEYAEPGRAKVAWGFRVEATGASSARLTTETRIRCPDRPTLRRFRAYWAVVGPFSGIVRRVMLHRIRREAESAFRLRNRSVT